MKNTLLATIALIAASASSALAADGAATSGTGLITYLFFGFFALILANQLLPGLVLFVAGIKGLFSKGNKTVKTTR